jgi:FdhD protein
MQQITADGSRDKKQDTVPYEILLRIVLNKEIISAVSCSPGNLVELAYGYAVSNGYVDNHRDICFIELGRGNGESGIAGEKINDAYSSSIARIKTVDEKKSKYKKGQSCRGFSKKIFTYAYGNRKNKIPGSPESKIKIRSDVISGLDEKNISGQKYKSRFGGLHSASLFGSMGQVIKVMEDTGRRNCIDKILGYIFIRELDPGDKIIFTSGRISADLVFKMSRIPVPVVVTNSSVSYNAAVLGARTGLTIVGYARGKRFNIYSCPERIV